MAVRIGFIGAGGIAGSHINALKKIPKAQIVAIADIDIEKANQRASLIEDNVQTFSDYREMLDKVPLDAIWLCTPQNVRAEPIDAAIEKNIPVFTEKPVADSLPTAQAIAKKIEAANLPVSVGYVLRYMKIVDKARQLLENDKISLVNSIYCCPMSLDYRDGKSPRSWFFKKEISGGALVDQATHLFDMLRYIKGDIADIYAMGDNVILPKDEQYTIEDVYAIAFRFTDGVVGTHGHTWGHSRWYSSIVLFGEKGRYTLDFMKGQLEYLLDDSDEPIIEKPEDVPMYNEDLAFVEMVEKQNFSAIKSTFADGVKTLEFTLRCLEVLNLPLAKDKKQ